MLKKKKKKKLEKVSSYCSDTISLTLYIVHSHTRAHTHELRVCTEVPRVDTLFCRTAMASTERSMHGLNASQQGVHELLVCAVIL